MTPATRPEYIVDGNGCWIWQRTLNKFGYGKLTRKGRSWAAHRWYYLQANGDLPRGDLHHTCCKRACVNPAHLAPATRAEHSHAKEDGRSPLTWDVVRAIRASALSNGELAAQFGVQKPAIVRIKNNTRWYDPAYKP